MSGVAARVGASLPGVRTGNRRQPQVLRPSAGRWRQFILDTGRAADSLGTVRGAESGARRPSRCLPPHAGRVNRANGYTWLTSIPPREVVRAVEGLRPSELAAHANREDIPA
jgi:hypothetical protein